jgi:hypothetical protein
MALSKLTGVDRDPAQLNVELRDKGAFEGGDLRLDKAAEIEGVQVTRPIEFWEPGAIQELDRAIDAGEPVLLRVDHTGDDTGDHTVLITGRNPDGSYRGIDPAGGYQLTMVKDSGGNLVGAGWREYRALSFRSMTRDGDTGVDE